MAASEGGTAGRGETAGAGYVSRQARRDQAMGVIRRLWRLGIPYSAKRTCAFMQVTDSPLSGASAAKLGAMHESCCMRPPSAHNIYGRRRVAGKDGMPEEQRARRGRGMQGLSQEASERSG